MAVGEVEDMEDMVINQVLMVVVPLVMVAAV